MKPLMVQCYRKAPTLDALHEHMVRVGETAFEKKGSAPFLWSLALPEGLVIDIETPWSDDGEKLVHTAIITLLLKVFEVTAYSFMSEVWVSVRSFKSAEEALRHGAGLDKLMPSDDPEAEDVLMIASSDASHRNRMTRFGVKYSTQRPKFGRLLARDDGIETSEMGGHMFDLFRRCEKVPGKIVDDSVDLMRKMKAEVDKLGGSEHDTYAVLVGTLVEMIYRAKGLRKFG